MLGGLKKWFVTTARSIMETRPGQIPALDGLRTIAVTLVIAGYSKNDLVHAGAQTEPKWLFDALFYSGWTGVDLFFVLSGFLIGRILFQEVKSTGTVAVGSFLLKRGLRIWPLYYFICAIVLTKLVLFHQLPPVSEILPDLFFVTNFFKETLIFGSWSLSVEEQFYLFAAVFILISRRWVRSRTGKITHFLLFLFCCVPFARLAVWNHFSSNGMNLNFLEWEILHAYIFTHCDGLLIGLIFASVVVFRPNLATRDSWIKPLLTTAVLVSAVLTWVDHILFKYTFVTLIFASMLWSVVTDPKSLFARILSWKYFQITSRLSYGMYLWYRFPLWRIASETRALLPGASSSVQWWVVFMVAFTLAALLAAVTYALVERPFLQLRDQIFSRKTRKISSIGVPVGGLVMERVRRDYLDRT